MTREEAKKAAEVMMAYADGKEIEIFHSERGWKISQCPAFNWGECPYRIKPDKPEPKYRPFRSKEECWAEMQKHQPFGWVSYGNRFINILNIDDIGIDFLYDGDLDSLDYLVKSMRLKFVDGIPFGIKEE